MLTTSDGLVLTYVSNRRGYEHNSCANLHRQKLTEEGTASLDGSNDVLIGTVGAPSEEGGFPGLYPNLPGGNWLLKSPSKEDARDYVVLQSTWGSHDALLTIDINSGKVLPSDNPDSITSWTPLATDGYDRVVAIRSSLLSPPQIMIGHTVRSTKGLEIKWNELKTWSYAFETGRHCEQDLHKLGWESALFALTDPNLYSRRGRYVVLGCHSLAWLESYRSSRRVHQAFPIRGEDCPLQSCYTWHQAWNSQGSLQPTTASYRPTWWSELQQHRALE